MKKSPILNERIATLYLSLVCQFPYYLYSCNPFQWNSHYIVANILHQYLQSPLCFSNDNYVLILNSVFSTDIVTKRKKKKSASLESSCLRTICKEKKIQKSLRYLGHLRLGVTDKERHVVDFILYHKVLLFPFEILEIYRRSQLEELTIYEESI